MDRYPYLNVSTCEKKLEIFSGFFLLKNQSDLIS